MPSTHVEQIDSQQPKKKRHRFRNLLLTLIVAVAIIFIINALTGGDEDTTTTGTGVDASDQAATDESEATTTEPGIGDPARDGKFEFVVIEVEAGADRIGEGILEEEAQGQFILVRVEVENIGDQAQYLSASDQYLYDADGRQYSASNTAWAAIDSPLLEQINPGNSIQGTLVFDVPENMQPVSIELHDSPFSDGVLVTLD
jgi:hypothetical protein